MKTCWVKARVSHKHSTYTTTWSLVKSPSLPTLTYQYCPLSVWLEHGGELTTNRLVQYAWLCLWNQLCDSFHRPRRPTEQSRFPVIWPITPKMAVLRHLVSPGYASGTIAVNVTWMERGFNACKTSCTINPYIFNHLWDIARYLWEIATFHTIAFNAPVWGDFIRMPGKSLVPRKIE